MDEVFARRMNWRSVPLGLMLFLALVAQAMTGLVLSFPYDPLHPFTSISSFAFDAINKSIVDGHRAGATLIFALLYAHIMQKVLKCSYWHNPTSWLFGVITAVVLMITAGIGQVIRMSQRGYWGLSILRNVFYGIFNSGPVDMLVLGDINTRLLFWIHVAIPSALLVLIILHVATIYVHSGSIANMAQLAFGRYIKQYSGKFSALIRIFVVIILIVVFSRVLDSDLDSQIADPRITPEEISSTWYFAPFYAVLSFIYQPTLAAAVAIFLIGVLLALPITCPWVQTHKQISNTTSVRRSLDLLWIISAFLPAILSRSMMSSGSDWVLWVARVSIAYYFLYFAIIVWIARRRDSEKS